MYRNRVILLGVVITLAWLFLITKEKPESNPAAPQTASVVPAHTGNKAFHFGGGGQPPGVREAPPIPEELKSKNTPRPNLSVKPEDITITRDEAEPDYRAQWNAYNRGPRPMPGGRGLYVPAPPSATKYTGQTIVFGMATLGGAAARCAAYSLDGGPIKFSDCTNGCTENMLEPDSAGAVTAIVWHQGRVHRTSNVDLGPKPGTIIQVQGVPLPCSEFKPLVCDDPSYAPYVEGGCP